jgi:anti-sigma factor RsiW
MNCPLVGWENRENAELLLAYCQRQLDPQTSAILERHMAICPACREWAANQRAVEEAMDAWQAPPVSADFDRRLFQRIEANTSWWQKLTRPFYPGALGWNGWAAATACAVLFLAGAVLQNRPPAAGPAKDTAQVESVQPEQVERALDAMDTLSEFSHHVKDSSDAKM